MKDIKSQKTIAGFFLDPYSRTGEKRGGAWMDVVVSRSSSVFLNLSEDEKLDVLAKQGQNSSSEFSLWTKSENSSSSSSSSSSASSSSSSSPSSPMRRLPVAHLVCNQPPPHPYPGVTGTVSLMNWTEVETLFHEFGHGLHHMLTQVNESEISGVNGVEWDAVELPSQFMERWCSLPSVLSTMVEHVATKEKLDTEKLSQTLEKVKTHMNGITTLNQLRYGVMDMFLYGANLLPSHSDVTNEEKMFLNSLSKHISHPIGVQDVLAVQRAIASRFSVVTPIPDDRFLCSFSHIFGGGYSAG